MIDWDIIKVEKFFGAQFEPLHPEADIDAPRVMQFCQNSLHYMVIIHEKHETAYLSADISAPTCGCPNFEFGLHCNQIKHIRDGAYGDDETLLFMNHSTDTGEPRRLTIHKFQDGKFYIYPLIGQPDNYPHEEQD